MCDLKLPASIPLPRRADRTLLPAVLTALLAAMLLGQLLMPSAVVLPDAQIGRPMRLAPLAVPRIAVDPEILARPLFAPNRRDDGEAVVSKASPLEGARAVGVIIARGAARVFLQDPDGTVSRIGIGGVYRGWRLVRITPNPTFMRGNESVVLPVAASVPPVAPAAAAADESEEEEPL